MSELIYGRRRAVEEALRARRRRIYRLWLEGEDAGAPSSALQPIVEDAESLSLSVRRQRGGIFDKLAQQQVNHQGVALEVDEYPYVDLRDILAYAQATGEPPLLLILDHVQDPQNLGTLIRTAEAMAVHGIIIPDRRAARVTPSVSNASAGAVELIRVAQVTNLNRTIDELKARNVWIAGLDSAESTQVVKPDDLKGALALVVGSEGAGLTQLTRQKCDFVVRLPMYGQVASLNAAVAGSIVLYLARQSRFARA